MVENADKVVPGPAPKSPGAAASGGSGLRGLGLAAATIGFLIAWALVLARVVPGDSSDTNLEWFGHLTAVLALGLFTAALVVSGLDVKGLVVGKDNRLSTSKLQALIWTYAIAAALLSLVIADWAGAEKGYAALLEEGLKDEYLLLLGGPFAAAVAAKAIISAKADRGEVTKTEGTPKLAQAASDDAGNADLVDTQYLLFNFVALSYFVGAFVKQASDGLPEIPGVLVGLTGVAAATYVTNKAVLKEAPTLVQIVPSVGGVGQDVMVFGRSLRLPKQSAQGELEFEPALVTFNDVSAPVTDSASTATGDDRLQVTVPAVPGLEGQSTVNVRAFNARGVPSNALTFTIQA
jgi:hypothetical protein